MTIDVTPQRSGEQTTTTPGDAGAPRSRIRVPWLTVAVLALVLSFADGFWRTSLQGAVGSVERAQGPFVSWLQQSTLLAPVFALAVLAALALARRRYGPAPRRFRTLLATGLLVVAAGTMVGVAAVAANSAYDYYLQSNELATVQSTHFHTVVVPDAQRDASCDATCQAQRATLGIHLRALGYVTPLILITNLVLVGWVIAIRGGRLDAVPIRKRAPAQG